MTSSVVWCCRCSPNKPPVLAKLIHNNYNNNNNKIGGVGFGVARSSSPSKITCRGFGVWAAAASSSSSSSNVDSSSSSDFVKRMEQAWLISQQPRPIACSSCNSNGHVECKWCAGTGFFILGDNMLCQVPSRNTTCVICAGKGSMCCADCKGTGFRAKWLGEPPISK